MIGARAQKNATLTNEIVEKDSARAGVFDTFRHKKLCARAVSNELTPEGRRALEMRPGSRSALCIAAVPQRTGRTIPAYQPGVELNRLFVAQDGRKDLGNQYRLGAKGKARAPRPQAFRGQVSQLHGFNCWLKKRMTVVKSFATDRAARESGMREQQCPQ